MKYGWLFVAPLALWASMLLSQDDNVVTVDQGLYLQQTDIALREGRLTQAGQMIFWLESNGSEVSRDDVALLKAEHAIAGRDVAAAAAALSTLESPNRNLCRVQAAKGWVATNLKAYDSAVVALAAATQACPDDAGYWNLLGLALIMKGESDGATEAFGRAFGLAPNDPGILNNNALALLQMGQIELAMQHLTLAAAKAPDSPMITANKDFVAGMLGVIPDRRPQDSDSVWTMRLVNHAQGAKAAANDRQANVLFSRALLAMERFDQTVWSEIDSGNDKR